MHTATLFTDGESQTVNLPKACRFEGVTELSVKRDGESIVLTPKRKSWLSLVDAPKAGDDFLAERPDLIEEGRVKF